ncbi:Flagellar hook-associated protein FlgL [hydrothermal vent metagenome]|uniref:Flagellar hook-associated protein FlgL n=1 Tax=hydrothermal vent metagenome TaxID=652676 RepID=A0A3B0YRF9_9ZZZZ
MRIGTLQLFRQGLDSMLSQQSALSKTQLQLSTGKQINSPSDDPTGAAQLLNLSETIKITEQYQLNIQQLQANLPLEENVLGSVVDNLQRARELAIQGLNATNNADDRAAIAQEIRQIGAQVLGIANSKNGNGEYLFSGFQGDVIPFSVDNVGVYSYAGDQGQRELQIGPTRRVAGGDSGLNVFMKITDASGAGPYQDVFTTLETLAVDLEANAPNGVSLDQLDNALENIVGFQASIGARLNAIDSQENTNSAILLQLIESKSNIEDLDLVNAAALLSQQTGILQAAQQAFVRVQSLNLFNFL